jgi:hypothetical protein
MKPYLLTFILILTTVIINQYSRCNCGQHNTDSDNLTLSKEYLIGITASVALEPKNRLVDKEKTIITMDDGSIVILENLHSVEIGRKAYLQQWSNGKVALKIEGYQRPTYLLDN